MKRFLLLISSAILLLMILSCGNISSGDQKVVKVGFAGESDYQIWNPIVEKLAEEGIKVELVSFSDYTIPNQALNDGEIDLNAFQHYAYFNDEVSNKGYDLTAIADTYISAMNIYSTNITDVKQLKNGDKIAIPNDPSNGGRALKVLQAAGIIKVKPEAGDTPSVSDIIENPLSIEIVEMDAGAIYGVLPDVACAVINGNYAIDFGLNPGSDYIFKDDPAIYSGKSFVNLIAARTKDKDNELYKKVVATYQSEIVEKVYNENFKGSYLPTWK
ncbi:MetQ/NlpA family ABC transporter substrate-binding protein [uncultured Brachyspira sp.]|uniref:MetQ/NlpA family ABC transporter substrate-binding protein n=1 Tax=uncultured Brachyspira sp. TaxID=221953 RepID=UPI0026251F99|nr:MetQ/NlpA family ABC transporter substrate-binding protein [uncultured Brachyspira sp.]